MGEENVIVAVRCRPFSEKEKREGHSNIVSINKASVTLNNPNDCNVSKTFTYDYAFKEDSKQVDVYNGTARKIVDACLGGFNGCVFAYGQTGTGIPNNPELRGIIPNAFHHIFNHINQTPSMKYLVRVSFLEIYNEDIRDLLVKSSANNKPKALDLKEHPEHGVYVKDLSSYVVKNIQEMEKLMDMGNSHRSTGATLMNENSSRSHSIFTITIESYEVREDGTEHYKAGKLHLVDLAGSERQSKTGATGDRLKEATKINLSLSALGNVISALVDGKSTHIPYRDAKLTRLLQDSLGGNSRTLMIATISPASYNFEETMSTLRYANRAKNITNKPKINEDPKDALLREFQEEIKRLKAQLEGYGADGAATKQEGSPRKASGNKKRVKSSRSKSIDESKEEGTNGVDSSVTDQQLLEMQQAVEKEKQAILGQKDIEEAERDKLLQEIDSRAKELEKEREERKALAEKLAQLEKQVIVGDVNLLDKEAQQREMLAKRQAEIEEEQRKERELIRQLEESEIAKLAMEENYTTLQEEALAKTKKLKKLWTLYSDAKNEVSDLQEEHQREREDLLDTVRAISREIKLCQLVISNFVPDEYLSVIEKASSYDENSETWRIANVSQAGNNIRGKNSFATGQLIKEARGLSVSQQENFSSNFGVNEEWNPICVLPNVYLQYDDPKLTKKTNEVNRKISMGSSARMRPSSASNKSPRKISQSKSGPIVPPGAEIPSARGLVANKVRYA